MKFKVSNYSKIEIISKYLVDFGTPMSKYTFDTNNIVYYLYKTNSKSIII